MKKPFITLLCSVALAAFAANASAQQASSGGFAAFGDSPQLLSPQEAFPGELTHNAEDRSLTLTFDVKEGYYLYRDRITVVPEEPSLILDDPTWPQAEIYSDQFFGDSAVYRTAFTTPIAIKSAGNDSARINVTYQGCADIGVCFPPTVQSFELSGLATDSSQANPPNSLELDAVSESSNGSSVLAKLKSLSGGEQTDPQSSANFASSNAKSIFGNSGETLLSPTEAYRPYITATDSGLAVNWEIERGYYLYRDKLSYRLVDANGGEQNFVNTVFTEGETYKDEFFGETKILRIEANDQLFLSSGDNGAGELTVNYQGCADIGVCFPPETFQVPVTWNVNTLAEPSDNDPIDAVAAASASGGQANGGNGGTPLQLSEQDRLASQLANSSLWFNAAAFFVLGLLLAFTPCVLPMIPILSSLILGGGDKQTTGQAFRLSVMYVLGMALTYTLVGVLVGLSGYNIQAWFQDPLILTAFAVLFVVLSLAMFGVYELQVPAALQTKLTALSNKQSGGRSGGVFVMGILSALIVGPCVTAPLMGALIYIANTGDATVGGIALFSLSIGMGTPLLLIGTSAGRWVPKAGGWMSAVKVIFGFLMLAMAIWMLSRFLDATYVVFLSAALALTAGVWAVLEFSKSTNAMALRSIGTAAGVAMSLYGATLLVGALAGAPSLLKPLQGLSVAAANGQYSASPSQHLSFTRIKSLDDLNASIQSARAEGKSVMLDFYADWCVSCKEMEAFTFTDPEVQARLENVALIQADVTLNDKEDQALLKHFGLFGPPAIIFYDSSGAEIRNGRLVGFLDAKKFGNHLDAVLQASIATQAATTN